MTLQGYASRTGTRRNLAVLRAAGWRLLVAAQGVHRSEGFRYMLDNSAYTYWTHGIAADWSDVGNAGAPFLKLLAALGGRAEIDQVVAPEAEMLDLEGMAGIEALLKTLRKDHAA